MAIFHLLTSSIDAVVIDVAENHIIINQGFRIPIVEAEIILGHPLKFVNYSRIIGTKTFNSKAAILKTLKENDNARLEASKFYNILVEGDILLDSSFSSMSTQQSTSSVSSVSSATSPTSQSTLSSPSSQSTSLSSPSSVSTFSSVSSGSTNTSDSTESSGSTGSSGSTASTSSTDTSDSTESSGSTASTSSTDTSASSISSFTSSPSSNTSESSISSFTSSPSSNTSNSSNSSASTPTSLSSSSSSNTPSSESSSSSSNTPSSTSSSSAFEPNDISGTAFWFDAAVGVTSASPPLTSGDDVISWEDRTSNNWLVEQNTVSARPSWRAAGYRANMVTPGIGDGSQSEFLGINQALSTAQSGAVYIVVAATDGSNTHIMLEEKNGSGSIIRFNTSLDKAQLQTTGAVIASTNNIKFNANGGINIIIFISDGSSYRIRLNGVEETVVVQSGSNNGNWFGDITSPNFTSLIGNGSTGMVNNVLLEVVCQDGTPTANEIDDMETYLANKHGVPEYADSSSSSSL